MSAEVVGGIRANSLAILTDAAHSDVAAFAISLFTFSAAGWEATPRQSYGSVRIEVLGALVDFVNIVMALVLGHDHGHDHDHEQHGTGHSHGMTVTTHHDNHHKYSKDEHCHAHEEHVETLLDKKEARHEKKRSNINVQGAYIHVPGDSIRIIVLSTAIKMLRNILAVLMESTPREIDATKIEKGLFEMEDVVAIHELHVWAIAVGKILLACHVKIRPEANADMVLDNVINYIRREYSIGHVTIKIER
ncbi:METAL TOLERANCE PROTEIN A1 [Salix viminalis]|uniref:METAL TOLERANCE PROTEIN A1 n=1 Tax=Salix viminalis TaxID=40686 RepID=A0A9Q0UGG1_SALVM|nr:METAL TOLERANCE PROTEIN A1 [Salix viminalis]